MRGRYDDDAKGRKSGCATILVTDGMGLNGSREQSEIPWLFCIGALHGISFGRMRGRDYHDAKGKKSGGAKSFVSA